MLSLGLLEFLQSESRWFQLEIPEPSGIAVAISVPILSQMHNKNVFLINHAPFEINKSVLRYYHAPRLNSISKLFLLELLAGCGVAYPIEICLEVMVQGHQSHLWVCFWQRWASFPQIGSENPPPTRPHPTPTVCQRSPKSLYSFNPS